MSDLLELELQTIVSHHVHAWKLICVLCKSRKCSYVLSHLSGSSERFYMLSLSFILVNPLTLFKVKCSQCLLGVSNLLASLGHIEKKKYLVSHIKYKGGQPVTHGL